MQLDFKAKELTIKLVYYGPALSGKTTNLQSIHELVSGESRADASLERGLFCGAGASGASDFADYAAFMRFGYRASLQARYTTAQLGFRSAYDRSPSTRGVR